MVMWRCRCGEWISSTKNHKCKESLELKVLNLKESEVKDPFFKGYKSTKFFNI